MRRDDADESDGCVTDTVTEVWSHVTLVVQKKKPQCVKHFQLWILVLKTFEPLNLYAASAAPRRRC
jgi:hypothetical protein